MTNFRVSLNKQHCINSIAKLRHKFLVGTGLLHSLNLAEIVGLWLGPQKISAKCRELLDLEM